MAIRNEHKINVVLFDKIDLYRNLMADMLENGNQYQIVQQTGDHDELENIMINPNNDHYLYLISLQSPDFRIVDILLNLKSLNVNLKVLIISTSTSDYFKLTLFTNNINGYCSMPSTVSKLKSALKVLHEKGTYILNEEDLAMQDLVINKKIKPQKINSNEKLLFRYISTDMTYAEIAALNNLTFKTVDGIRDRLSKKLGVTSRQGLTISGIQMGYVSVNNPIYEKDNSSQAENNVEEADLPDASE